MTQIKLRRDTSANFTSANPVLGVGEPAYETDTKKLKIGDGTTAYTQLEYFSAGGGGGGTTDISATLPLKIVDGVISLEVDGQTIQIVDGKLHANLDELGNEVNSLTGELNTLTGDVASVQADLLNKQDKFETQVPLSISSSSITTSVPTGITETTESWSGGGPDKLITVYVSALNIDANSDWKIHLSGYMGDYKSTSTNTNTLLISAEKNTIFRVWFGSRDFRLGNGTNPFEHIPDSNREFFYEIVHQKNGTEFAFNGTDLVDSSPLSISLMSREIGGQTPYATLAGQGKLKDFSFVINSDQFQRIDRDITKSYFEANGVKYRFTSVEGTNTLNLNIGDGLSVVDGKLTASSTAPDKEAIMGYIMPDYSTKTEVPWNTDNTAPTDGYVEVFGEGDGSTSAFILAYTINGVKTAVSSCYATARNTNFRLPVICPKGAVYKATGGAVFHDLHFISMKGAV